MKSDVLIHSITKSLEIWTIITAFDIYSILLFLGFILHFAETYYKNTLKKFEIRVSKENWSILFFLIKDFSVFSAFGISLLLINPDMFADVKLPLPFFPLSSIFLGISLIFKLKENTPKNENITKIFLFLSVFVLFTGFVFVMEAIPSEWIEQGYIADFWSKFILLRSNENPNLSLWTFFISFPILLIIIFLILKEGLAKKTYQDSQTKQS